jgi:hypothetical protein
MDEQPRIGRFRGNRGGRSVPRSRPAAPTFTPPTSPDTSAEQPAPAPRRAVSKAVPTVLFKAPAPEEIPLPSPSEHPTPQAQPAEAQATSPEITKTGIAADSPDSADTAATPTDNADAEAVNAEAKAKRTRSKKTAGSAARTAAPASRREARAETATADQTRDPGEPETAGKEPLATQLLDRPGYAPELLAIAAVETLGPAAQAWVRRIRATYPTATPEGLARLATREYQRLASAGVGIAATAGLLAPLAGAAAHAWAQASLVLRLAAAYGLDPAHPDRAVDLLVLGRVHPSDETARAALAAAQSAATRLTQPLHPAEVAFRLAGPLTVRVGGWLALRLASRLLPGAALVGAAVGASALTERFAARAVARFRELRAN